jgi:tRNA (cmo5U34)-methyltransferase
MSQFHFDPASYLAMIRADVPAYDELQERAAAATADVAARRILDLGAGTGETARQVLAFHPGAALIAIDESPRMLDRIDDACIERRVARLQDSLPEGSFDLVVSVLAVHHLTAPDKRDLFARVRGALRPGGRFVLGDVVLASVSVASLTVGYDNPDRASDQLRWLEEAGFTALVEWERDDLALLVGDRP